ncbi:MAG: competence/damage-inducible protein A [Planctomycetota bacterium]
MNPQVRAEILSVGDEVVAGEVVDSNAAWLSRRLGALGIDVVSHRAMRDEESEIVEATKVAAARSDLVIVTGGIGPTHDDRTREAVARAAGRELVIDQDALDHVESIFAAHGRQMPPSNRRQAAVPDGADILRNQTGTAAGFRVRISEADIFVLPGVPREMKRMFEDETLPLLPAAGRAIVTRTLRCFGLSESGTARKLERQIDFDGAARVAFLANEGVISVKFTARADSREAAEAQIEPALRTAREVLGDAVFGEDDDTLERVVARLLDERDLTLALAESCTGGLVANWLTDVPGVSAHFLEGCVTYGNESKTQRLGVPADLFETVGAVSEPVARAMAEGVRERSGADVGASTTGIAGPTGGRPEKPVGTVHVAVAAPAGTVHRQLHLRGDRLLVKNRAARHCLDLIRRNV